MFKKTFTFKPTNNKKPSFFSLPTWLSRKKTALEQVVEILLSLGLMILAIEQDNEIIWEAIYKKPLKEVLPRLLKSNAKNLHLAFKYQLGFLNYLITVKTEESGVLVEILATLTDESMSYELIILAQNGFNIFTKRIIDNFLIQGEIKQITSHLAAKIVIDIAHAKKMNHQSLSKRKNTVSGKKMSYSSYRSGFSQSPHYINNMTDYELLLLINMMNHDSNQFECVDENNVSLAPEDISAICNSIETKSEETHEIGVTGEVGIENAEQNINTAENEETDSSLMCEANPDEPVEFSPAPPVEFSPEKPVEFSPEPPVEFSPEKPVESYSPPAVEYHPQPVESYSSSTTSYSE